MVTGERLGPSFDAIGGVPGEKPIPVLKGLILLDDACGTQVLTPLVPSQEGQLPVPAVPQEQK